MPQPRLVIISSKGRTANSKFDTVVVPRGCYSDITRCSREQPMLRKLIIVLCAGLIPSISAAQKPVVIHVNAAEMQGAFRPVWAYVGHDEPNYTYAPGGRELLSELSALSAYPVHDRTHNLLTTGDGMPALKWGSTNAFTLDTASHPAYNWTILDRIFDAYRDLGITPYVEIGFMPKALSTHPEPYQHHYPLGPLFTGWSYPPTDYNEWAELVYRWVKHSVQRYGREQVANWDWEVWNEPDIGYWHGTLAEYCKLYDYTTAAVKRTLPQGRVGGPATTGPASPRAAAFLQSFLQHCASGKNYATGKVGAPLDFISFHAKGRAHFENGHVVMDMGHNLRDVDSGFAIISKFPKLRDLPVVISESDPEGCAACAASNHPQNRYRNTSQYASYEAQLLQGELALAARYHINLQGAVTWAFTFPGHPYFTGFRSFTTHDVDKPLMNLYRMLGMMTGERVAADSSAAVRIEDLLKDVPGATADVNAIAARDADELSILVWNYDDSAVPAPPADIELTISGLPDSARHALLEHFRVDQDHSNAYTAWKSMSSPQDPSPAQVAELKAAGQLHLLTSPRWLECRNGTAKLEFTLPRQGVSLLRITW
jgi:xylan 1,4-beta-xylosidase